MGKQIGSPERSNHQVAVDEALQQYREKAAELNEARTALLRIGDRVQALQRNAQAAQTEADEAKAAWTTLLRDGDGTLTKEIQKYRASERSAHTLIEEYEAIHHELKRQYGQQEVVVASLAGEYEDSYRRALRAKAELALDRAMERVGVELGVARQLHDRAERDINEIGQPVAYSPQALRDRFMTRVDRLLIERSMEVSEMVASELDDLVLDMTAVDKDLMRSPLARQQRLREIAASA